MIIKSGGKEIKFEGTVLIGNDQGNFFEIKLRDDGSLEVRTGEIPKRLEIQPVSSNFIIVKAG